MLRRLALHSATITPLAIRSPDKILVPGCGEALLPTNSRSRTFLRSFIALHQMGNKESIEKERARPSDELSGGYFADISEIHKNGGKCSLDELSGGYFADILKTYKIGSKVALAFQPAIKYSTRVSGDLDTHDDFLPTNKSSDISIQDAVQQEIKENTIMIYMKGLPDAPRCGFSALAVKVLQLYGVPIRARDILGDPKLKEGVKAYTNWPTFPQIFIKGEFVGGSDIIFNMHQKGELKDLLADIMQDSNKGGA